MSYRSRIYRQRNAQAKDEKKEPFFTQRKAFFQAKPAAEQPGETAVQRLATTPEEEIVSTNDKRMERDKEKPFQRKAIASQTSGQSESLQMKAEGFCPNGDVDDATVQSHVDTALATKDLKLAFAYLRSKREQNCCDLNLAAAEHYMWARLQVAEGLWSFFMIAGVIGYDFFKFVHLVPHTGDCPTTRASWAQIKWATNGAVDGENDYYSNPQ